MSWLFLNIKKRLEIPTSQGKFKIEEAAAKLYFIKNMPKLIIK